MWFHSPLAIFFAALIATATAGWAAYAERRKHRAVEGWRKVRGRVREARACEVQFADPDDASETMFEPLVLYDYSLDGRDYIGTRVGLSPPQLYPSSRQAADRIRRYRAGYEVVVYVDPANPNHALLDPRVKAGWLTPAIGLLLLAGLIAVAVVPHLLAGR